VAGISAVDWWHLCEVPDGGAAIGRDVLITAAVPNGVNGGVHVAAPTIVSTANLTPRVGSIWRVRRWHVSALTPKLAKGC
jgi:hypothetical protein